MIRFEHVTKTFGKHGETLNAVEDVSLVVNKGEIFGIIGYSGAGKSTLLRLVNLLEMPTSGYITVNERNVSELRQKDLRKLRRNIGMIFQQFNLFQSKTVFGNVAYPLKLANASKQDIEVKVNELLSFVGLADKAKYYPNQLSGGQKQRVGIARALATSPEILICDEATSALDPETTAEILNLLKKVNKAYQITILLITHEMQVIKQICHRVAVMEKGRVIETGSTFDVFSNPQTLTAKNFISSVLNDQLSIQLLQQLRESHAGKLYRLIFKDGSTNQPILSRVAKKYQVDFNIAYGSINALQKDLLGNLIVEFIGDDLEINKVITELEEVIELREVVSHES